MWAASSDELEAKFITGISTNQAELPALALYSGREYEQANKALMQARSLDRWSHDLLCEAQSEADAFVSERRRELAANGADAPAKTLDFARTRADRYRDSTDRDHFLDGLRKAGLTGGRQAAVLA